MAIAEVGSKNGKNFPTHARFELHVNDTYDENSIFMINPPEYINRNCFKRTFST